MQRGIVEFLRRLVGVTQLAARLDGLSTQQDDLAGLLSRVEASLSGVDDSLTALAGRQDKIDGELDALHVEMREAGGAIRDTNEVVQHLLRRINALRRELQAPPIAAEDGQEGCARFIANGSENCLIWFAGRDEPFLNPDFLRWQPDLPLDGLFFIDAGFDWYMHGLHGLAEGCAGAVLWLQDFIRDRGYKRVFLGGQSSGGYAALRFARRIRPTAVIVFSPQTRNIVNARGEQQPDTVLEDLACVYAQWDSAFPIHIHLSRSEREHQEQFRWDDWAQIRPFLDMDNVTVIRHPFDRHAVSIPLHSRGIFYRTILSTIMLHSSDPPANPKAVAGLAASPPRLADFRSNA